MRANAGARAGRLALAAALLALAPGPALASPKGAAGLSADYQPPAWPEAPSSGGLLARLGVMTAGTIGCAAAALWWARRAQRTPAPAGGTGEGPRLVASLPLAGRCALHLLEVDRAEFVVATDASGLKAIQMLPPSFDALVDDEIADGLVAPPSPPEAGPGPEEPALIPRQLPLR